MGRKRILFLIEVPIFAALALILDIAPFLSFKIWAQGGSISFAMIPIFIIAFRWGIQGGMLSGLLYGLLQIIAGEAWILNIYQGILDYGIAFTGIGLAGIFARKIHQSLKNKQLKKMLFYIMLGTLVGSIIRFVAHYFAGVIFFGSAIEGMSAWKFSLYYNGSYMLPNFIIATIVIFLIFERQPRALLVRGH